MGMGSLALMNGTRRMVYGLSRDSKGSRSKVSEVGELGPLVIMGDPGLSVYLRLEEVIRLSRTS